IHQYLADVVELGEEKALERVPEKYRAACECNDLERLPVGASYAPEVAFAFDVFSGKGRELGRNLGRDYSGITESEVPGTADVVALVGADGVLILDYKTGYMPVPKAAVNWQLRHNALAACRAYGRRWATVGLIYVHDDEEPRYDQAELDELDICAIEQELRELVGSVEEARALLSDQGVVPDAVMGAHCRFCPAFAYCPAQTQLIREIAAAPEKAGLDPNEALTPEQAATAWDRIAAIEAVLKTAKESVKEFAKLKPIQLANGNLLGEVEESREKVVPDHVKAVLTELHGPDVASKAFELKTSKAAIERALKPVAGKGQLAGLKRTVLAALEQRGGILLSKFRTVKEFTPTRRALVDPPAAAPTEPQPRADSEIPF
ncbi:MAG: DUF2800 domain-containing protein, partial [Myxococcales bacterium]